MPVDSPAPPHTSSPPPTAAPRNTVEPVHLWSIRGRRWLLWGGWVLLPLLLATLATTLYWVPPIHQWPDSPTRSEVTALLARVHVIPHRHHVLGYERACTGTSHCSFGKAWTDNSTAPGGHNGHDTRTDMLRALTTTQDPYTGLPLPAQQRHRHIDHIFPLAAAWDMGAAQWSPAKRVAFANDTARNLVVVAGDINIDKGDSTPSEWLPPWRGAHCWYAARYLTVATYYQLSISQADWRALRAASRLCRRTG